MKRAIVVMVMLFTWMGSEAQSKKKIQKHSITSVTETDHENGRTLMNRKKVFNKDGEVLEDYDYDKHGELVHSEKFRYNGDGEVVEKEESYPETREYLRSENKFNGLGEKTEEHLYNRQGIKVKIHYYTYDSRGLKT